MATSSTDTNQSQCQDILDALATYQMVPQIAKPVSGKYFSFLDKASVTAKNLDLPVPSFDPTTIAPLLFDMKTKLAELEAVIYKQNGALMKQKLETLFAHLAGTNFDEASNSAETLGRILDPTEKLVYMYEPYLAGKADQIVYLLARQFRHFYKIYLKTVPNTIVSKKPGLSRYSKKHPAFQWQLCTVFKNLVECPIRLARQISREALYELIISLLPLLVKEASLECHYLSSTIEINLIQRILLPQYVHYNSNIWRTNLSQFKPKDNELDKGNVIAVLLRMYHRFLALSQQEGVSKNVKSCLDVLGGLLCRCELPKAVAILSHGYDLSAIFFEIYKLFDVYSGITMSTDLNLRPLEDAKQFITTALKPWNSKTWAKHFALVNKELSLLKRSDDQVPFCKWLASVDIDNRQVEDVEEVQSIKKETIVLGHCKCCSETKHEAAVAEIKEKSEIQVFKPMTVDSSDPGTDVIAEEYKQLSNLKVHKPAPAVSIPEPESTSSSSTSESFPEFELISSSDETTDDQSDTSASSFEDIESESVSEESFNAEPEEERAIAKVVNPAFVAVPANFEEIIKQGNKCCDLTKIEPKKDVPAPAERKIINLSSYELQLLKTQKTEPSAAVSEQVPVEMSKQPEKAVPTVHQPEPEVICLPGTSSTGPAESEVIIFPATEQDNTDASTDASFEVIEPTSVSFASFDVVNLEKVNQDLSIVNPTAAHQINNRKEILKEAQLMQEQMLKSLKMLAKLMAQIEKNRFAKK